MERFNSPEAGQSEDGMQSRSSESSTSGGSSTFLATPARVLSAQLAWSVLLVRYRRTHSAASDTIQELLKRPDAIPIAIGSMAVRAHLLLDRRPPVALQCQPG